MMMEKKCLYCGKCFIKPVNESLVNWENRRKFCSKRCANQNRVGKNVVDILGKRFGRLIVVGQVESYVSPKGNKAAQWKCICDCGQVKIINGNALRMGTIVSCGCFNKENAQKLGLSRAGKSTGKGKRNGNWKGGITPINIKIRRSKKGRLWRKKVFTRDNYTCQKCKVRGGKLCPHHIQNFAQCPELRFVIDNGITLCKKCHRKFHKKYGIKNNTKEQLNSFIISILSAA